LKDLDKPYTLISFASNWGSKFGGINAFNSDFLEAIALAYYNDVDVICIVFEADEAEIEKAKNLNVTLVPLAYPAKNKHMQRDHATAALKLLKEKGFVFQSKKIIYLGHDIITGDAALAAKEYAAGTTALIHHMSYSNYESFSEDSQTAKEKENRQKVIFKQADIRMAVGPLLHRALEDLTDEDATTIIPGLPKIATRNKTPNTFSMFVSGRLTPNAAKVKQGQLAVAAFAESYKSALEKGYPAALMHRPKLLLRGVEFGSEDIDSAHITASESNLKDFANERAGAVINLQALPFITDRKELFDDLRNSSACAMPSWHEGFGLVAWEAIAAGIPLIITKDSGVYQLIKKEHAIYESFIWPVQIKGSNNDEHFEQDDLLSVSNAINEIASNPEEAREKAEAIKMALAKYTWENCDKHVIETFDWPITQGVINKEGLKIAGKSNLYTPAQPNNEINHKIEGYSLAKPTWQFNEGISVSSLLKANEAIIPFDNSRQAELDKLITWSRETLSSISIRMLTGAGGVGKTRLALEFCQYLQNSAEYWSVGFLAKDVLAKLEIIWQKIIALNKPTLFVLDYAESQTEEFLALLKLVKNSQLKNKVCFLLLARDSGEWWDNLPLQEVEVEDLFDYPVTTGPYKLSVMYDTLEKRQQAYQNAIRCFANILKVIPPNIKVDLEGEHFNNPLYLQMAALLALYGEHPKTADGITRTILNHEERYWQAALKKHQLNANTKIARYILTLSTLTGQLKTPKEAFSYYQKLEIDSCTYTQFSSIFECLSALYPEQQGIPTIKPDLLAEALVAKVLSINNSAASSLLVLVLNKATTQSQRKNALTVITRLSAYNSSINTFFEQSLTENLPTLISEIKDVALATRGNLIPLTINAFHAQKNAHKHSVATQFSKTLTHDSIILNHLTYAVNEFIYHNAVDKQLKKPKDENKQYEFVIASENFAAASYYLGKSKHSCNILQKSLPIITQLNKKNPVRYCPDYAASLSTYATFLAHIGKDNEAERYAKQALDLRYTLQEQNIDRYSPDYASSLASYAIRLKYIGKDDDAKCYAKQGLDIYHSLHEQNPERYRSDYAVSLSNYANLLNDTGKYDEAERYAKQALDINHTLQEQNPDRYRPNYAASLSGYATFLSEIGKDDEAESYAKQALDINHTLQEQNPDRYLPVYAMLMSNYANRLSEIGKDDEAESYAKQALDIFDTLREQNLDRHLPDYAMSISNYANILSNIGKDNEAERYAKQSFDIHHMLQEQNPDRYIPDYTRSLNDYINVANNLGDYSGTQDKINDFYEMSGKIYIKRPKKNAENYINSLKSKVLNRYLINKKATEPAIEWQELLNNVPIHKKTLVTANQLFIESILGEDKQNKTIASHQILEIFIDLPVSRQREIEGIYLLSGLWFFHHGPESKNNLITNWQKQLGEFIARRNNNIPQYFVDIAKKWQLSWL
jgi:glycosyltransferase involved in cell wall biosynthesis